MMNEFIELRRSFYKDTNPYIFIEMFFDKYIKHTKVININEINIIKKLQRFKQLMLKSNIKRNDICEMLTLLGHNEYLDRYISDVIIEIFRYHTKSDVKDIMYSTIFNSENNSSKVYHALDISIECKVDILNEQKLLFLFDRYKTNFDVTSILLDYIYAFKIYNLKDYLYELLERDFPTNIKIQLLDLIRGLYSFKELSEYLIDSDIKLGIDKDLYCDYIDCFNEKFLFKKEGLLLIQSMFYGDFEDSGKGNNGGLAVFLKNLGNEISKDERVSNVVTITISDKFDKPFIKYYNDNHLIIRLPIYIDMSKQDPFIKRELYIKRHMYRFLKRTDINPDIFHIRYLDNASRAISLLRKELGKKLVFTLTPDPHRNMFDVCGNLKQFNFAEFMEKLNKIKIGDELIYESDGIIGIGNNKVRRELELYFPQLKEENISQKVKMIGESVQSDIFIHPKRIEEMMQETIDMVGIDKSFFEKPIVLNVGRLNSQKGQDCLLRAWGESKLSNTHNLLIIGGDMQSPNKEEKKIINSFEEYIEENPQLKNKFLHIPALPNESIRIIEKNIMNNNLNYPNIYLCSSKKEEFGIAILEAMLQKFLVLAPINGGVKSYIVNRKNGFLIDTSSEDSIRREAEKIIYDLNIDNQEFKTIQNNGQKTVETHFSMEKIAKEFLSFYLELSEV